MQYVTIRGKVRKKLLVDFLVEKAYDCTAMQCILLTLNVTQRSPLSDDVA
jgi:hypothetical protein